MIRRSDERRKARGCDLFENGREFFENDFNSSSFRLRRTKNRRLSSTFRIENLRVQRARRDGALHDGMTKKSGLKRNDTPTARFVQKTTVDLIPGHALYEMGLWRTKASVHWSTAKNEERQQPGTRNVWGIRKAVSFCANRPVDVPSCPSSPGPAVPPCAARS